jgi:hypothetical protein
MQILGQNGVFDGRHLEKVAILTDRYSTVMI